MLNDNEVAEAYTSERIDANDFVALARERIRLREENAAQNETAEKQPATVDKQEPGTKQKPEAKADNSDPSIIDNIAEIPGQALGGFLEATKEVAQALESVIPLGTLNGGEVTEESFLQVERGDTMTGGFVRGVSQFLTGFFPALKGLKAVGVAGKLGTVGTAAASGAVSDALVFDPHEARLSNLVQEYPALDNPVTEYLAAKPEDSDAEGRFKNAVEGLGLGLLTDGFVKTVKVLRSARVANKEKLAGKRAEIQMQKEVDKEIAADIETPTQKVDKILGGEEDAVKAVSKEKATRIIEDTANDGDFAVNINMNRIDSEKDVQDIIRKTADEFTPEIDKARRGKISLEETEKLADDLGMTTEQLIARNKGEAFNAEQAVAARKVMISTGDSVVKLAKQAQLSGSSEDKFALMKAITIHRAVQEQVSGLTAEAGRALSSFRIMAKSAKDQQEAIDGVINSSGNKVGSKAIDILAMADNPKAVNGVVDKLSKADLSDVVLENFYNSLLSAPGTHIVNIMGNASNMLWNATSRYVTPAVGRTFGDQETSFGEAGSALFGMMQGMKDGFKFAAMAMKSSDFVLEAGGTMEMSRVHAKRAISKETFNLTGVPGKAVDILGSVIRTPGRALTAGDAFFRSANQQMEIYALAHRTAVDEGLSGPALGRRVKEITDNPTLDITKQAAHFARVQTFTNDLEKGGRSFQQAVNSFRPAKLVVPFIRTPVNIIKTVAVNSPLAPLSKNVRTELMAGGARRDKVVAQMAMGSSVMAGMATLEAEGFVTGAGPVDPDLQKTMKLSGWQPFSFHIGDTYYPYNRLDPIGMFIGFGASYSEISGRADETDVMGLASELVLSTYSQIANKTFVKGLADTITAMDRARRENSAKPLEKWLFNTAASATIPLGSLSAALERGVNPTFNSTEGYIDRIRSRTPGFSDDLPAVLNVFGEPVMANGGLAETIMSPVYRTVEVDDSVIDELVRVQVPMGMPNKTIDGIRLNTQQYHDYTKLAGQETEINGKSFHPFLKSVMKQRVYIMGTDERRQEIIKQVTFDFRSKARAEFKEKYPEFGMKVKKMEAEKAQLMRATRIDEQG